jgi:hypothetical protein
MEEHLIFQTIYNFCNHPACEKCFMSSRFSFLKKEIFLNIFIFSRTLYIGKRRLFLQVGRAWVPQCDNNIHGENYPADVRYENLIGIKYL